MDLNDFDYELPECLIAQKAASPKDSSRLMVVGKEIEHRHFYEIIDYLGEGDVLVLNETRVSRAKASGKKLQGSKVEIVLTERAGSSSFKCRIKGRGVGTGREYELDNGLSCTVTGQGAGIAAAVSIKDGVNSSAVNIHHLQETLQRQNVRIF